MIKIVRETEAGKGGFFSKLLNGLLEASRFRLPRERIIRPSGVTECMRYIVADILNMPMDESIDGRVQRIFDNGSYVHKRYLKGYLPKLGIVAKVFDLKTGKKKDFIEISVSNADYWLKGSPDAVIINFDEGLPYVFELKSIKAENFYGLTEPDWPYLAQIHLYMFLTGIPRALMVYESKNTQEIKEFVIKEDPSVTKRLLERIRQIQAHVEANVLPQCENKLGRYKCKCTAIKE